MSAGNRPAERGLSDAERALLVNLVPPAVIVNERGDIVHIHGRTGPYLEPAPGSQVQTNIFNVAREGLRLEVASAMRAAGESGQAVHQGIRVTTNGDFSCIDLRVKKLSQPEALRGLFLIAFEAHATDRGGAGTDPRDPADITDRVANVERELQYAREFHQDTVEELDSANEELKSANEELESTNEELQSVNEKLETSKEEMQSLNEELQTVNAELHGKVEELSRANDDMSNFLNSTDIATLFLDGHLHIKRYTEHARQLIPIIQPDLGRHVGDLSHRRRYTRFAEDAEDVLRTLVFKEREVQGEDGAWYLMRIRPYRTLENIVDGLVVTFVDTTNVKALEERARRMVAALCGSPTFVFGQDRSMRYDWVTGLAFGYSAEDVIGRTDADLLSPEGRSVLEELKHRAMESAQPLHERLRLASRTGVHVYEIHLVPMIGEDETAFGLTGVVTRLGG